MLRTLFIAALIHGSVDPALAVPGDVEPGFNPLANGEVASATLQPDGRILIGGAFTTVGGVARNRIARLNADGTLDTGFNPNANADVRGMMVQANGKILISGQFTEVGGITHNRIARLNADGSLDTGFDPNASDSVRSVALQADGKIVIGGFFFNVGGFSHNYVARLDNDAATQALGVTSISTTFQLSFAPSAVDARWAHIGIPTNDFHGYYFQFEVKGLGTPNDAALSNLTLSSGTPLNPAFSAATTDYTAAVGFNQFGIKVVPTAAQEGATLTVNGNAVPSGSASGILPLNIGANTLSVRVIALDGITTLTYTVVVTRAAPSPGDVDPDFNLHPDFSADGSTYISDSNLFSMSLQPDGKILCGGDYGYGGGSGHGLDRRNGDGTLDAGFTASVGSPGDGAYITAVLPNGNSLIGGSFGSVNGVTPYFSLVRLNAAGESDPGFNPVIYAPPSWASSLPAP